jgi:hypothetical protein
LVTPVAVIHFSQKYDLVLLAADGREHLGHLGLG